MTENIEQRFLAAQAALRKRVKLTEGMAAWKADLANRLWRAEIVMRGFGVDLYDFGELEREVGLFNEVVRKLEEKSGEGGTQDRDARSRDGKVHSGD